MIRTASSGAAALARMSPGGFVIMSSTGAFYTTPAAEQALVHSANEVLTSKQTEAYARREELDTLRN